MTMADELAQLVAEVRFDTAVELVRAVDSLREVRLLGRDTPADAVRVREATDRWTVVSNAPGAEAARARLLSGTRWGHGV